MGGNGTWEARVSAGRRNGWNGRTPGQGHSTAACDLLWPFCLVEGSFVLVNTFPTSHGPWIRQAQSQKRPSNNAKRNETIHSGQWTRCADTDTVRITIGVRVITAFHHWTIDSPPCRDRPLCHGLKRCRHCLYVAAGHIPYPGVQCIVRKERSKSTVWTVVQMSTYVLRTMILSTP